MYQLNGLDCGGWQVIGQDAVEFSMACAYAEVSGLKGAESLKVTDGDGTELADFSGYELVSQWEVEGAVRARFLRKLEPNTEAAIRSLESNMQTVSKKVDTGLAEASATAEDAKKAADEAKQMAEQGGTDPQLQALARAQVATMDLSETTCDEVIAFRDYWPEWQPDTAYKHNQPLTYQGRFFRTSKNLTSQAIYPPGSADSEYYEVTLAPDGIINWYNVGGEYNMVRKGEKRHYPDAEGPVYRAKVDTAYSPDTYPDDWTQE